jgi:hypothetical protein
VAAVPVKVAHGFQREVGFAIDEEAAVITQLVRATLDK